jgi:hypothetical protein
MTASASELVAASVISGTTGPCRSTQRSASAIEARVGSARSEAENGWKEGSLPDEEAKRSTPTPLMASRPGGRTSFQVTKSSAQLVRTCTSQPFWATRCSASKRAAVSAPPRMVVP